VALLTACNVALWLVDVLRCPGLSSHHHDTASHRRLVLVLAPVAIFHRFISVVCLLLVWRKHTSPVHSTTSL